MITRLTVLLLLLLAALVSFQPSPSQADDSGGSQREVCVEFAHAGSTDC